MTARRARRGTAAIVAVLVAAIGIVACGRQEPSDATRGVTITVALAGPPPPAPDLAAFTRRTGVHVRWVTYDWDSLQTKISAAAMAHTYFADATDVDWSRVGAYDVTHWFYPMDDFVDVHSIAADLPQLSSFVVKGKAIGLPYDTSFGVMTLNTTMLAKAGVTRLPTTMAAYTAALHRLKDRGVLRYPLNVPFAAAEGLSTYWYQATAAFGGRVLTDDFQPAFAGSGSPGYRAFAWLVGAYRQGLVSPGAINVTDAQGQQTLMAQGQSASTFSDFSGNVAALYDLPSSSKVVGQIRYLMTPGVSGPAPNINNPDGIGIPKTAKYPKAAAEFAAWFLDPGTQATLAGLHGQSMAWSGFAFPARLSALRQLQRAGKLNQGNTLIDLLTHRSRPVFAGGPPPWYPQFSNAVYVNLHSAANGQESVASAIKAISSTVGRLRGDA